jgi:hypothetical protein
MELIKQPLSILWAETGDVVSPIDAKISEGWLVEAPARQHMNWWMNRTDTNMAYLMQHGIPEWDATTEYILNKSYVQYAGNAYKALATNINVIPGTDAIKWSPAMAAPTFASEAIKTVTPAADKLPYFTSGTTAAVTTLTAYARTLLDDSTALAARATLDAQQADATLTALAGVAATINTIPYFSGTDTAAVTAITAFGRSSLNVADAVAGRALIGLNLVDNTSDANKPISTATATALTGKLATIGGNLTGAVYSNSDIHVFKDGASNDPYGPISVTRGTAADFAYFGLTRSAQIGWGIGVGTDNALVFGQGGTAPNYAMTAVKARIAPSGAITAPTFNGALNGNATSASTATLAPNYLPLAGGNLTGDITGLRCNMTGSGNDYNNAAFQAYGNGAPNSVFPTIGFHQPTQYAASLQLRGGGDFRFYNQGGTTYANVTANQFNGSLNGNAATVTNGYYMDGTNTGWFRSTGAQGWFNSSYGGGMHMTDTTYVRTYNGKSFLCTDAVQIDGVTPQIRLNDTGWGVRYLYHDAGLIGFLDNTGNWKFTSDNAGNTQAYGNMTAANYYGTDYHASSTIDRLEGGIPTTANQAIGVSSSGGFGQHCFGARAYNNVGGYSCYFGRVDGTSPGFASWYYQGGQVGSITTNGSSTAYNTTSDYRLKQEVKPLEFALERVLGLSPRSYQWKASGMWDYGFIAHELASIIPVAVTGEKDAVKDTLDEKGVATGEIEIVPQVVDYSKLVVYLVGAIQEQQVQIDGLLSRITALEEVGILQQTNNKGDNI